MYLSELQVENFRCWDEDGFVLQLRQGLNALVGENDSGKSAVIDALRLALGTVDQEWQRVEDSDFYGGDTSRTIKIACAFSGLSVADKRAFAEHLTYGMSREDEPLLHIVWTLSDSGRMVKGRPYRRPDVSSGRNGCVW